MHKPKQLNGWDFSDAKPYMDGYETHYRPELTEDNFNQLVDEYNNLVEVVNILIDDLNNRAKPQIGVAFEEE